MSSNAPQPARITIEAQARPMHNQAEDKWALEIILENSSGPITPSVWEKLTATTPNRQEKNQQKASEMGHSTGVGVFAARHLLRNGLGKNSDIRFQMAGPNLVQARMTIPVLLSTEALVSEGEPVNRTVQNIASAPLSVLYVEDDKINFAPTMEALQERNSGDEQSIVHVVDKHSALAHAEAGLPNILITDLSFYESLGDSTPDPKNGYKMLQDFAKLGRKSKQPPPIWIVTGDERNAVISELEEFSIAGETYEIAPTEGRDEFLTRNGMISILDNSKDLSKKPELLAVIQGLLKTSPTSKADVVDGTVKAETQNSQIVVERILLGKKFPENLMGVLQKGLGENSQGAHPLIVYAEPPKTATPQTSLGLWFASEKIPDYHDYDPEYKYSITSSTFHKSFFLHLKNAGAVAGLGPDLHYWFIRHNVLINKYKPKYAAELWAGLINESKGPLSRLRHDVMNLRLKALPSSFFDTISTKTHNIESLFKIDAALEKELLGALRAADASIVEQILGRICETKNGAAFAEALKDITDIEATLVELSRLHAASYVKLRTTLPSLIQSVSATRQLIFTQE